MELDTDLLARETLQQQTVTNEELYKTSLVELGVALLEDGKLDEDEWRLFVASVEDMPFASLYEEYESLLKGAAPRLSIRRLRKKAPQDVVCIRKGLEGQKALHNVGSTTWKISNQTLEDIRMIVSLHHKQHVVNNASVWFGPPKNLEQQSWRRGRLVAAQTVVAAVYKTMQTRKLFPAALHRIRLESEPEMEYIQQNVYNVAEKIQNLLDRTNEVSP